MRSLRRAINSTSVRFFAILTPYVLATTSILFILHYIKRPGDDVVHVILDLFDSMISSTTPFWLDMLNAHRVRRRYNDEIATLDRPSTVSEEIAFRCFEHREWHRQLQQRSSTPLVRAFAEQVHGPNWTFADYLQSRIDRLQLRTGVRTPPSPEQMGVIYHQIITSSTQSSHNSTILAAYARRGAILLMSLRAIIAITIAMVTSTQEESMWVALLKDEAFRMVIAIACASSALGTAVFVQASIGPPRPTGHLPLNGQT